MYSILMKKIAIIGAGASGTLLSIQLLKQLLNQTDTACQLTVFDHNPSLGKGIAYTQTHPCHLLNVPVEKMIADASEPDGFYRWISKAHPDLSVSPKDFVPRAWFGDYLNHLLQEALSKQNKDTTFQHLQETIIDLDWDKAQEKWALVSASGNRRWFDIVVLALGNAPDSLPSEKEKALIDHPRFIQNPWDTEKLQAIQPHDHVFILGTGLTMVDKVLELEKAGFRGKVTALSRRGHLPHCHSLTPHPANLEDLINLTPKALMCRLRGQVAENQFDWRQVVDGLRPHTQSIWQHWNIPQKKQFLRHLSSLWEIHRHRLPPSSNLALNQLKAEKRLTLLAGRPIQYLSVDPHEKIEIRFQPRGKTQVETLTADWVINCAGAGNQLLKRSDALMQNLIQQRKMALDDLQFSFKANSNLQLSYLPQPELTSLYGIGPILKGSFWECTAIAEIRQQAEYLAQTLLQKS
jgi:uncharacterized NAD(P)/FAD-binding protein YdhS